MMVAKLITKVEAAAEVDETTAHAHVCLLNATVAATNSLRPTPFNRKPSTLSNTSNTSSTMTGEETSRTTSTSSSSSLPTHNASSNSVLSQEIIDTLKCLNEDWREFQQENDGIGSDALLEKASDIFAQRWKLKDEMSEVALRGMLLVLEHCLSHELINHIAFSHFIDLLGYHTVFFWKKAVPYLYDSDLRYGTNYREALLFSLTLYDANTGKNRLRELFAAVPGLRDSLLAKPAKRFEEAFNTMLQRRMSGNSTCMSPVPRSFNRRTSLSVSQHQSDTGLEPSVIVSDPVVRPTVEFRCETEDETGGEDAEVEQTMRTFQRQHSSGNASSTASSSGDAFASGSGKKSSDSCFSPSLNTSELPDTVVTGALSTGHFQERVIAISNAPPVSFRKRAESGNWEIGQGSGGLVSCCAPVMNKDTENVWMACFGPDVPLKRATSRIASPLPRPPTNSLGIPLIRTATTEVHFSVLQEPNKEEDEIRQDIKETMSLLTVLKTYNRDNYKLNPVLVSDDDYNFYYGGISNGLLWPALHNLSEYILKEYDDETVLLDHWNAYVRVNYQFAINAIRNSRTQDFLWIHDYHLLLTGAILQSLDPNLEVGFFLHIPFLPPDEFFAKYKIVAEPVLRGMLAFNKVGFQTHRDRARFVELVGQYLPNSRVEYHQNIDTHTITRNGFTASLGVFPVSIKNEEFLDIARSPETKKQAEDLRQSIMGNREGKFFFSVERFDYTKGIKEKLQAYKRYYERHPDRLGKDIFMQVAVVNRRSVATYRQYQDECLELANLINTECVCADDPEWKPLIFKTDGLNRSDLIPHYLAMDVGVVTPKKDGMNLVAKEMLICNPFATLILSSGAGTEQQFEAAGFFTDKEKCFHRLNDVFDLDNYADMFYEAAIEEKSLASSNGHRLSEFLMANDIEKWSEAFLDPGWAHDVIKPGELHTLTEFYDLMFKTRDVRRQIVDRVLKGVPIRLHFATSLRNAKTTLEQSTVDGKILQLKATPDNNADSEKRSTPRREQVARLDVSDELCQLEIDLAFLDHVQSDDYDNMEQFMSSLAAYHPESADAFANEVDELVKLIAKGDHFQYFFTDRDGTLKSPACSYPSSIQGAYSGVIQATFAHRCTQYAAIVTSAPLANIGILDVTVMPEGYFCIGASAGREWYVEASRKFKDNSISDTDLAMLDVVAEKIQVLLQQPKYRHFTWVGSGLQKHYGHITISRQDCYGSIDEQQSLDWYSVICDLVNEVDPTAKLLHVHDSETDIKIFPRAKLSGRVFNKGHGIQLFCQHMGLDLSHGNVLVFGDSETDLPMLKEALHANPENTYAVWVTVNEDLRQKVSQMCGQVKNTNFTFVSTPEAVLGAMAQATVREIKIRPSGTLDSGIE